MSKKQDIERENVTPMGGPGGAPGMPQQPQVDEDDAMLRLMKLRLMWDKYGTWIMLVVLVGTASYVGWSWMDRWGREAHEADVKTLATATDPTELARFASSETDDPYFKWNALHLAGHIYLNRSRNPEAEIAADQLEAYRDEQLEEAASSFRGAASVPELAVPMQLKSKLMLAEVLELQGKYQEARETLTSVLEGSGDMYLAHKYSAEKMLDILPNLERPLTDDDYATPAPEDDTNNNPIDLNPTLPFDPTNMTPPDDQGNGENDLSPLMPDMNNPFPGMPDENTGNEDGLGIDIGLPTEPTENE